MLSSLEWWFSIYDEYIILIVVVIVGTFLGRLHTSTRAVQATTSTSFVNTISILSIPSINITCNQQTNLNQAFYYLTFKVEEDQA